MRNHSRQSDAERLIRGRVADMVATAPFGVALERQQRLIDEVLEEKPLDLEWTVDVGDHVKFWFEERKITIAYASALSLWAVACATVFLIDEVKAQQAAAWKRDDEDVLPDPRIELSAAPGEPIGQALEMIRIAKRMLREPATPWLDSLPVPQVNAEPGSIEWRVINLFGGAIGWVLLHEIGHFTCGHALQMPKKDEEKRSEKLKALEFQADEWATRWMLDDAPTPEQSEFRMLAIAVALIWLGISNSVRRTSPTHPSAWERFAKLMDLIKPEEDGVAVWLSGCMMKAFFSPFDEAPVREDAGDLFTYELIRALRREN